MKYINKLICILAITILPALSAQSQSPEYLFEDFRAAGLTREDKKFLQAALAFEGHYNGLLDGDWGKLSQSALENYSWSEFDGPAEEWHMAFLALNFFRLYDRDGWEIEYNEPLRMSFMVPSKAIESDPPSDAFANFRHSMSSLAYSIGVHDVDTAQNVHDFTLDWHELSVEPYSVRKNDFAISTGEKRNGAILYTRSNFVDGAWSTIMLSANREDVPILNAVAASISKGYSPPLAYTVGGRIDTALRQTLDVLNKQDDPEQSAPLNEQFIQVSSHASFLDAVSAAKSYQNQFPAVEVYETQSGFFAVVLEKVPSDQAEPLIRSLVFDRLVPADTYPTAGARFVSLVWVPSSSASVQPDAQQASRPSEQPTVAGSGSGFYVSLDGHLLTNEHVVKGCSELTVDGHDADVVASSADFDLALLRIKGPPPSAVAAFSNSPAKLNSDVTVAGFPLSQILSGINVTRGAVSSQVGFQGDATQMQITAPVQSGNSGGPVLASNGQVVGVVVSKLDSEVVANNFGDTPQNVNFAVRGEIAKLFLSLNGVEPTGGDNQEVLSPVEIAERAKLFTSYIECLN